MQHIENAMSMKWKKSLFGGKMIINNDGKLKVPAYIAVGQEVMENYAEKSGGIAQNIFLEVLFNRSTTAHILGGCPMSEDIREGVVDPQLRVHGFKNMFVIDGSVIQGNIGVNPSFSILAMAEYAMDRIPPIQGNTKDSLEKQLKVIA